MVVQVAMKQKGRSQENYFILIVITLVVLSWFISVNSHNKYGSKSFSNDLRCFTEFLNEFNKKFPRTLQVHFAIKGDVEISLFVQCFNNYRGYWPSPIIYFRWGSFFCLFFFFVIILVHCLCMFSDLSLLRILGLSDSNLRVGCFGACSSSNLLFCLSLCICNLLSMIRLVFWSILSQSSLIILLFINKCLGSRLVFKSSRSQQIPSICSLCKACSVRLYILWDADAVIVRRWPRNEVMGP